jgi:hypothetical protein
MKRFLLAALVSCALSGAATAQEQTRWVGAGSISDQTGTCPNGNRIGDRFFVRFRPSGLGNGPESNLNLFDQGFAQAHKANGRFSRRFKRVQYLNIGGGSGSNSETFVRFRSQSPSRLTTTTPFIDIVAEIRGYDFQPRCTVTLRVGLTLETERP